MASKMLIDASHEEETRVVVVRGNRIEEFDFESEHKKQLKGNIYLAKVTRVEPSLQAAFVEYGGNRHGFLAFSEIHPDYYQIPKADRQALIEEELARAAEEDDEGEEERPRRSRSRKPSHSKAATRTDDADAVAEDLDEESRSFDAGDSARGGGLTVRSSDTGEGESGEGESHGDDDASHRGHATSVEDESENEDASDDADETASSDDEEGEEDRRDDELRPSGRSRRSRRSSRGRRSRNGDADDSDDEGNGDREDIDQIGSEDALEEVPVRQVRQRRQYKIQEVIKRRQILLVQVVKEERGNKGAALTTYLSLAGRYSVLMPNTARGGGISRKITNAADRKRLKDVVRDLDVPRGMGIILRTAGANRTKAEVKRDYEYLMRLWETVRTVTLSSIAPALVYEEGSLIKRSIRDLYNKDIDQILVSGETGYREAKDFMRMLMPSQAKVVQPYRDPLPIFTRQGIESQLEKMVHPHVTLKSGGYIIINQTEALVAIDVNSGRSTREHSIEDTALQTNLEAAEEIARQLRLRDLAGLIVIDFIDMEEKRNNRAVEKKIKDCLKSDRARIQVGSISHFGLLEMSRQRIRASVLESTMQPCPLCEGSGHIRSSSSSALHVLRTIEEHLQKHAGHDLIVKVPTETALYVLNEKRRRIDELERHHGLRILIEADEFAGHHGVEIEHGAEAVKPLDAPETVYPDSIAAQDAADREADEAAARRAAELTDADAESAREEAGDDNGEPGGESGGEDSGEDGGKRRRRRRRRRRGDGDEAEHATSTGADALDESREDEDTDEDEENGEGRASEDGNDRGGRKRRRRGRRGGRRNREGGPRHEDRSEERQEEPVAAEAGERQATDDGPAPDAHEAAGEEAVTAAGEAVTAMADEAAPAASEAAAVETAIEETPAVSSETTGGVAATVETEAEASGMPAETVAVEAVAADEVVLGSGRERRPANRAGAGARAGGDLQRAGGHGRGRAEAAAHRLVGTARLLLKSLQDLRVANGRPSAARSALRTPGGMGGRTVATRAGRLPPVARA